MKPIIGMAFVFAGIVWIVASFFVKTDTEAKKSDSLIMLLGGSSILGIGVLMIDADKT